MAKIHSLKLERAYKLTFVYLVLTANVTLRADLTLVEAKGNVTVSC